MGKRPSDYDLSAKELIFGKISKRRPSESDVALISRAHQLRSSRARSVDEGLTKNVTNIPELWLSDPARFDFMGVDTKRPKNKKGGKRS